MKHQIIRRRPGVSLVKMLTWMVGLPATAATLLSMAGSWWWVLDLFSHFRWYYTWALGLAVCLSLIVRHKWALLVLLGPLVINGLMIAPLYMSSSGTSGAPSSGSLLRLLHINVHTSNQQYQAVIDYVNRGGADLVFLQEVNAKWIAEVKTKVDDYRVDVSVPRQDNFGIALLVANRLGEGISVKQTQVTYLGDPHAGVPAIEVALQWHDRQVSVLSLHTLPPVSRRYSIIRDRQLAAVAGWAGRRPGSVVLIGDLNTTAWSSVYRALATDTGWVDSQWGRHYQPTFPAHLPIKIPIDHCLHSGDLMTIERVIGPAVGSDHLPLAVTLSRVDGS